MKEFLSAGASAVLEPPMERDDAPGGPRATLSVVGGVDGYTKSVAGVQVEAVRTGLGTGPNRVLTLQDDRFLLTSSAIGFPMRTRTTISDDRVIIGCVEAAPPGSRWCEFDLRPGTVLAYGPGVEHTGVSPPGLRFDFAAVMADDLGAIADQLGSPLDLPPRGKVQDLTRSPNLEGVRSALQGLAAAGTDRSAALLGASDTVLGAIALALVDTERMTSGGGPRTIDSRHVVHRCIDYADAVGRIPAIGELCVAAHVSERKLRRAFTDEFDVPPSRFFRDWGLTLARRRLTAAVQGDRQTVTDIALDLGFSHLGRFSSYYRELYGETPSATLRSATEIEADGVGIQPALASR